MLEAGELTPGLKAQCCPSCQGAWIPAEVYETWQPSRCDPMVEVEQLTVPSAVDVDYQPSAYDNRAGLCPECGYYLVRGRVNLRSTSFFVERCPTCKGIWCDRGEWQVLEKLDLDGYIPVLFSDEWQGHIRLLETERREKQATVEKLGQELAEKVFELADLLEQHPNGDFGVAYLMRRFEQ